MMSQIELNDSSQVRLISITPDAEKQLLYCARVSNPGNQSSTDARLLEYCVRNEHWSVFEMAHATFELSTSRAIAAQILRHRSFSFQEFSQRYAHGSSLGFVKVVARRQDAKNRQNSIDDMSEADQAWFTAAQDQVAALASGLYSEAIARGVAKEQARFLLPLSTATRLYMTGSIRSWIHYLKVRCDKATQAEHRHLAEQVKLILAAELPTIAGLL